ERRSRRARPAPADRRSSADYDASDSHRRSVSSVGAAFRAVTVGDRAFGSRGLGSGRRRDRQATPWRVSDQSLQVVLQSDFIKSDFIKSDLTKSDLTKSDCSTTCSSSLPVAFLTSRRAA